MQANVIDNDLKDLIHNVYLSIERDTENNDDITEIEVKQGKNNVHIFSTERY
jgi:hypothetical protein